MRSAPKRARGWGGARVHAGRPASGPIASEPHKTRPVLSPGHPLHVIARLANDATRVGGRAPAASRRAISSAVRRALRRSLARGDFRIVAIVVRTRCIELVVEADSAIALARGMQGFQVSTAHHWNRARGRSGTVFPDRYRPLALRTRAAVRAALATVDVRRRVAWPATHLLRIEVSPDASRVRLADPDP